MSITLIIPQGLRVFTENNENLEVTGSTVGECLEDLVRQYPAIEDPLFFEKDRLWDFGHNKVSIFLNDEDAGPDELRKPVKDGDTIRLLFAISGG